jgi:DNA-binding MarR family transcriptional regulator
MKTANRTRAKSAAPPAIAAASSQKPQHARHDLANRMFFRLYQCANLLHKTGTRAVERQGLTTQQWAVLGALSRPAAAGGMGVGELARYLMVSRQNLSGVLGRLERDGRIVTTADPRDRRSRLVTMTPAGRRVWRAQALPRIHRYYDETLEGFSNGEVDVMLRQLLRLLENMQRLDAAECPEGATARNQRSALGRSMSMSE